MEQEINDIIAHHNIIQDPGVSEKIELLIQKQNNTTIPSIILEYLSQENEAFVLEDQKQFFDHFGEVLNIIINEKKILVLFKTFFIANICKKFLENENIYKDNKKENFKVRWFDFEKDENLLAETIRPVYIDFHNKNLKNLKQNTSENKTVNNQNYNNANNNIGIKMNMNMNINNFNINTTMNPMGQNPNIVGIPNPQYLQFLQMQMKMNKNIPNNNIPQQGMGMMPNYNLNHMAQMQLQQQQNAMHSLNMIKNMQNMNLNNNINNINLQNNMNKNFNNNVSNQLINQNIQQLNNQHFNQNFLQKNLNQNINNNDNDNNNSNNNNNDEKNFGKYTCKYQILIANDKEFQIARRLIGSKGCNMKKIRNECKLSEEGEGIKLRLRGKGSGYKEGPQNKESDEPLHLCISSKNAEEMKKACLLVDELLEKISDDYKDYCEKNNVVPVNTKIAIRIDNKSNNFKGK